MTPFYLNPPGPHWFDDVPRICVDFETTNIEHGDPWVPENRIVYTAIAGEWRAHLDVLIEPCVLVAHNAKFELAWLAREGYDIANILPWDTMVAEYVLAGNRRVALDLDSVARRYGLPGKDPVVDALMRGGVCPSEIPAKWIQARGDLDAATTLRIASKQQALLEERGLMSVFFTRCITTPVLALIEGEGMTLNAERVAEEVMRARLKKTEIEAQLVEMSGGINLRSGKQLGEFLYEKLGFDAPKDKRGETLRTKNGHYITNKTALAKLAAKTPQQKEFLKLRAEFGIVDAALSKSLEFFWGVCAEHGGHFRARFNQCVTQTHRLSSSGRRLSFRDGTERGVQFQNLPRTFKRLFRAAAPDHLVVESDGAQLEFRVAGELGQDVQVKQDVEEEADIHRFTASVLKRKPESEVTSKERTDAKAHCFPLDTELLTPSGWKRYDQLAVGDTIISYSPGEGTLVNDVVLDYAVPHTQEVVEMYNGHNWAVRSTPGHRWYGEARVDRGIRGRAYEKAVFTTEHVGTEHKITTAAPYVGGWSTCSVSTAERLAWLWTDGTEKFSPITGKTSQGVDGRRRGAQGTVIQKKYTEEVARLFGDRTSTDSAGCGRWSVPAATLRALYKEAGVDPISPDYSAFILRISAEARAAWLRAVCLAEGTQRKGGEWRIAQNSGPLADAIKLAGVLCGHDVRVTRVAMKYNGKQHEQILLRKRAYVTGQRIKKRSCGEQLVWCVSTRNRTVVMRQGDTISISGNTFKPLYGGEMGTKREMEYYKAFREKYPGVTATQEGWLGTVLRTKQLRTASGLIFYWPEAKMSHDGYVPIKPSVYNYPIQSFATADIIPISLVYTFWEMKARGIRGKIVNTVHDSVVAEIHKDDVDKYHELVKECWLDKTYRYVDKVYGRKMWVPLGVGFKAGEHWGEGEEIKTSYGYTGDED